MRPFNRQFILVKTNSIGRVVEVEVFGSAIRAEAELFAKARKAGDKEGFFPEHVVIEWGGDFMHAPKRIEWIDPANPKLYCFLDEKTGQVCAAPIR